jgi:hypothetical protein
MTSPIPQHQPGSQPQWPPPSPTPVPQPASRRSLWIVLACIGGLVVLCCGGIAVVGAIGAVTKTATVGAAASPRTVQPQPAVSLGTTALAPSKASTTPQAATQRATPTTAVLTKAPPTAWDVVDAFATAGLPAPNPRDNSKNCTGTGGLGCTQLITTDAISVYQWPNEAGAKKMADTAGPAGAYRNGVIVVSYAAARTPEGDRPKYEAVLADLLKR